MHVNKDTCLLELGHNALFLGSSESSERLLRYNCP